MAVAAILMDNYGIFEKASMKSFLDITVSKLMNFTDEIYFFSAEKQDYQGLKPIFFKTAGEFLSFLSKNLSNKHVLILNAYSPLLDVDSLREMLEEHQKYVFDFTYPENLPFGLLPEIIEGDVAGFIKNTVPDNIAMFKHSIKEVFERDLSSYDCNIFISESRLVKYRVNFIPDNYNDFLILNDIMENFGCKFSITGLEALISKNPGLIRKRPTYIELELNTERESGEFFISSRLSRKSNMKFDDFMEVVQKISDFSKNPIVSIGLYGEPFLYPRIDEVIEIFQKFPDIQFLIESRCLFNDIKPVEKALDLQNVKVIFDLSFNDPDLFKKFKKPLNSIIPFEGLISIEEKIKNLSNREKIYIQFTRTTLNENEIMKFYDKWKDFSDRIIIKKPDTFGGEIEQFRVVDLSPVKRFACLHLKHDMVIFSNGDVPLCRQDYEGKYQCGNILKDGVENCWNHLSGCYMKQWNEVYNEPPLCKGCDEWWVFNF